MDIERWKYNGCIYRQEEEEDEEEAREYGGWGEWVVGIKNMNLYLNIMTEENIIIN